MGVRQPQAVKKNVSAAKSNLSRNIMLSVLTRNGGYAHFFIRTFDFCGYLQYNNCRKRTCAGSKVFVFLSVCIAIKAIVPLTAMPNTRRIDTSNVINFHLGCSVRRYRRLRYALAVITRRILSDRLGVGVDVTFKLHDLRLHVGIGIILKVLVIMISTSILPVPDW